MTKSDLHFEGTPCILYGELYTNYFGYIDEIIGRTKCIEGTIMSKKNDIILPSSGETAMDISNSAVIPRDGIILGGDLIIIRPKIKIEGLFLSYQLSHKRKKDIYRIAQGASIIHLQTSDVRKLKIYLPKIHEQKKICTLILLLEKKIEILKYKLAALKKYKRGLQQFVFLEQESENIKLRNCAVFQKRSAIPSGIGLESGIYPLYTSGDKEKRTDSFLLDGIYIIANDGGEASFKITYGKFSYTDHCICFKCITELKTNFLFNYLDFIKKKISHIGFVGTGLKNIDRQYFGDIKIPWVDDKELELQSKLFYFADNAIETLKSILNELLKVKKNIINNVFI